MADNDLPEDLRPSSKKTNMDNYSKIFLVVLAFLIVAGLSFWGGTSYQKSHTHVAVSNVSSNYGGGAGGFSGRGGYGGGFGTVTAISSTSISVQNARSGTTTTYAITPSTVITDNGATVTYSDIANGDTVIVMASSTSSTTATTINVNPSYGGPGGTQTQGTSGT
jgi:hypothetical protein